MLQKFISITFVFLSSSVFAQQPPGPRPSNPEFLAQSRLVTLRFVPRDKKGRLYLAGNKAADIDFRKDAKVLNVTLFRHNQKKDVLQLNRVGESFQEYEIIGVPTTPEPYELQIRTEVHGKVEDVQMHIDQKAP